MEPPFTWRIEAHADHLRIFQAGTLTEEGARELAAEVDEACCTHRLRLALFDNRAAIEPDEATRAFMWSIAVHERFDAVALLMNTPSNLSPPPAPRRSRSAPSTAKRTRSIGCGGRASLRPRASDCASPAVRSRMIPGE